MFLEMGRQRFFGGPLYWRPGTNPATRDSIAGQVYRVLRPDEESTTVLCTDPEDHVGQFLADYHGPLVWRIQVRRGFVRVRDREISATAVVGVRFTSADVVRSARRSISSSVAELLTAESNCRFSLLCYKTSTL
jgi:hypothetical protein